MILINLYDHTVYSQDKSIHIILQTRGCGVAHLINYNQLLPSVRIFKILILKSSLHDCAYGLNERYKSQNHKE